MFIGVKMIEFSYKYLVTVVEKQRKNNEKLPLFAVDFPIFLKKHSQDTKQRHIIRKVDYFYTEKHFVFEISYNEILSDNYY